MCGVLCQRAGNILRTWSRRGFSQTMFKETLLLLLLPSPARRFAHLLLRLLLAHRLLFAKFFTGHFLSGPLTSLTDFLLLFLLFFLTNRLFRLVGLILFATHTIFPFITGMVVENHARLRQRVIVLYGKCCHVYGTYQKVHSLLSRISLPHLLLNEEREQSTCSCACLTHQVE